MTKIIIEAQIKQGCAFSGSQGMLKDCDLFCYPSEQIGLMRLAQATASWHFQSWDSVLADDGELFLEYKDEVFEHRRVYVKMPLVRMREPQAELILLGAYIACRAAVRVELAHLRTRKLRLP